jgi:hypothetical protein
LDFVGELGHQTCRTKTNPGRRRVCLTRNKIQRSDTWFSHMPLRSECIGLPGNRTPTCPRGVHCRQSGLSAIIRCRKFEEVFDYSQPIRLL